MYVCMAPQACLEVYQCFVAKCLYEHICTCKAYMQILHVYVCMYICMAQQAGRGVNTTLVHVCMCVCVYGRDRQSFCHHDHVNTQTHTHTHTHTDTYIHKAHIQIPYLFHVVMPTILMCFLIFPPATFRASDNIFLGKVMFDHSVMFDHGVWNRIRFTFIIMIICGLLFWCYFGFLTFQFSFYTNGCEHGGQNGKENVDEKLAWD
jgi:hypothetical protein